VTSGNSFPVSKKMLANSSNLLEYQFQLSGATKCDVQSEIHIERERFVKALETNDACPVT
jgi:hypothetical protein